MWPHPGEALPEARALLSRDHDDAVLVVGRSLFFVRLHDIVTARQKKRPPAMSAYRDVVEHGGLMSYGVRLPARWRRGPVFIDIIFRGARPADPPNEQPRTFELAINAKTAKRWGRRSRLRCSAPIE